MHAQITVNDQTPLPLVLYHVILSSSSLCQYHLSNPYTILSILRYLHQRSLNNNNVSLIIKSNHRLGDKVSRMVSHATLSARLASKGSICYHSKSRNGIPRKLKSIKLGSGPSIEVIVMRSKAKQCKTRMICGRSIKPTTH
jgi:hypothetical protein